MKTMFKTWNFNHKTKLNYHNKVHVSRKDKKMGVLEAFNEDCSEAKYHGEEIVENIVRDLNEPK